MRKIFLIKKQSGLVPWDSLDAAALDKLGDGEIVAVRLTKSRNPAHHRKMMAILTEAFDNQERYTDFDKFLIAMKIAVGHYSEMIVGDRFVFVPKSMSFENMDQHEFEGFYRRVVRWLADTFQTPSAVEEADEIIAREHDDDLPIG